MKKVILAFALCMAFSSNAQSNVIIEHVAAIKTDVEQGIQDGKDQLQRNKEQLSGLFFKAKDFVMNTVDKFEGVNNEQ